MLGVQNIFWQFVTWFVIFADLHVENLGSICLLTPVPANEPEWAWLRPRVQCSIEGKAADILIFHILQMFS